MASAVIGAAKGSVHTVSYIGLFGGDPSRVSQRGIGKPNLGPQTRCHGIARRRVGPRRHSCGPGGAAVGKAVLRTAIFSIVNSRCSYSDLSQS